MLYFQVQWQSDQERQESKSMYAGEAEVSESKFSQKDIKAIKPAPGGPSDQIAAA